MVGNLRASAMTKPTLPELERMQRRIAELEEFVETVDAALGCTDGDDIRAWIEPELKQVRNESD